MEANLWLVFRSLGQLEGLGSKQPWTLSHEYKKSLSPLGTIPHSSIGVFFSLPHFYSKLTTKETRVLSTVFKHARAYWTNTS